MNSTLPASGEKLWFSWRLECKQSADPELALRVLQLGVLASSEIDSSILDHLVRELEQAVQMVIDKYPNVVA
jgi:hypothetical protein